MIMVYMAVLFIRQLARSTYQAFQFHILKHDIFSSLMVYLLRVAFYVYKLAKNEEKKIMIADCYYSVNSRIKYSMFYTWNVYS